jgi:ribosomal protein L12E/L44/L45/RPP1/RPP2
VSLDVNQWRILSHAANNQNLRTICELTGIEPDTALRITAELLAIGLVEAMPTAPTRPTTAATSAARQQEASRSTPGQEQPAVEQAPPPNGKDKQPARVGRSLLNAILRRVSEL